MSVQEIRRSVVLSWWMVAKGLTRWHGVPVSHPPGLASPHSVPWVPTPVSSHCRVLLRLPGQLTVENEDKPTAFPGPKGVIL